MISAQLVGPHRFAVRTEPDPEPGRRELLVRVEGCGVCGSNLPPWRGSDGVTFPLEPGAPGHEAWGTVLRGGDRASGALVGRRVALLSYRAFAELDVVREDQVLPLPPELDGKDVVGEPIACAVNVARRAGVEKGDVVVVLGIGFLGALLLPLLHAAGPERLVAVSCRRTSREMAERMGATEILTYDEARDRFAANGGGAHVVIEATGKQGPLDLGGRMCRTRGRLIVAGYHQDGPRTVDMRLWNWRGIDVVNAHERDPRVYMAGMREGLVRLADGTLDLDPLITHRLPLSEIQRAFEAADARREGFFKAVVLPETPS